MTPAEQAHKAAAFVLGATRGELVQRVIAAHRQIEQYDLTYNTSLLHHKLNPIEEPPLTVKQVAARLNVSQSHVKELVREGHLPKIANLGTAIRITPAALDAFIHHQEEPA
jgi:excisionase family DNA binding protein